MAVPSSLCRSSARPNILDLPNDVLVNIFDYFQHEALDEHGQFVHCGTWDECQDSFQNLQNIRLVCRIFHQLSSRLLCPVLRLPLETSSLDKVDAMSKNSSIMQGVRVIQIVLQYRPKEIAQSLKIFSEQRLAEFGQLDRRCDSHLECWDLDGRDYEDDSVCLHPRSVYEEAMGNYSAMRSAWRSHTDPGDGEVQCDTIDKCTSILRKGHDEYLKKHEEQYRLINDGSLVEAVLRLASRAPRPCWLEFTDQMPYSPDQYNSDPTETLLDPEKISQCMSTPHKWETIEALGTDPDLAPMRLLATLPIAMHEQGITLQGVNISCFPLVDGHYGICGNSQHSLWDDFDASCKSLKTFSWGRGGSLNGKSIRHDPPQGEDRACLDRYFGAMLSSPHLEYIYLSFHSFGLNDGRGDHSLVGKNLEMDLSAVFGMTPYPRLKQVQIGGLAVPQVNFETFIQGLGKELQWFYVYYVELDGTWARIMELLREKYSLRCLEGRCKIHFTSLWGGEFGERRPKRDNQDPFSWRHLMEYEFPPEPVLVTQSLQYVNGDLKVTKNPLRRYEDALRQPIISGEDGENVVLV